MALDLNLISIIVFYVLIALFFWYRRKNLSVQYKILLLYRSKFWAKTIGKIAKKTPRFWQWFGYASVPAGFIGMSVILGFLTWKFIELFTIPEAIPAVSPVLPGIKIPGAPIFLPFWYGIIALAFVIIVHEFAHGFVAESWGLKLKSAGVGLLALLPLAFVEPDEKKLAKLPMKKQLSIFGAGPFSNIIWAFIIFLVITFAAAPAIANVLEPAGLFVEDVTPDLPAEAAGLQHGDIILGVDSVQVNTTQNFVKYMNTIKPGQTVSIETQRGPIQVTTTQNPENASKSHLGVQFKQNIDVKSQIKEKYGRSPMVLFYFTQLLYWILTLNIGIGLINLLPLGIMDGGRMLKIVLDNKIKRKKTIKAIWTFFVVFSLFMLLANLIGPYLIKAFI